MKNFITPTYVFTPGASGSGSVDLSAISNFDVKRLVAIINQTKGVIIYSTGSVPLRYTAVASGVVTLFKDTTGMSGGDTLQVIYESAISDAATNIGATNETVAASDTATSGINGLFKRLLQQVTALIALFPTTIGQKANSASLGVSLSTQQETILSTVQTGQGALTETAPATDTASSGLNGRLQRIAQRLTSLIGLLPGSLGQKAMAASLAVTIASDQTLPLPAGAATEATTAANGVLVGALVETAPASDTASSGLNGRLQRIAQRLTSLISLLPTALGQATMANSLAVTIASNQSALSTDANAFLDITGSASINGGTPIASTDVSKFRYISLAIAGTYSGILTFQGSNDNVNFFSVNGTLINTGTNVPTQFISSAVGIYGIPVMFKYFRVIFTSYTSGTATAIATAFSNPTTDLGMRTVTCVQSGSWTVTSSTPASVAGTLTGAQVTVGTTAVRATVAGTAPNAARKLLMIKPSKNNAGAIYYGPSTVTTANGMEIIGPDAREFDFDSGDYYLISDTAGQTVEILEKV